MCCYLGIKIEGYHICISNKKKVVIFLSSYCGGFVLIQVHCSGENKNNQKLKEMKYNENIVPIILTLLTINLVTNLARKGKEVFNSFDIRQII